MIGLADHFARYPTLTTGPVAFDMARLSGRQLGRSGPLPGKQRRVNFASQAQPSQGTRCKSGTDAQR